MTSLWNIRSFWTVLFIQAQVIFNDHASKLVLVGLAYLAVGREEASWTPGVVAALVVVPFVMFSPLAGWMADRYSKRDVLRVALVAQALIMMVVAGAVVFKNLPVAVGAFFFLALQSCFFSPAKQGIIKELVGSERLGSAVGWLEMTGIGAILAGSFTGGYLLDWAAEWTGASWGAGVWAFGILTGGCLLMLPLIWRVERTREHAEMTFHRSLLWSHFGLLGELWEKRAIRLAAMGITYFYSVGGVVYLALVQAGQELHGGVGASSESGVMLGLLGFGIAVGSMTAAVISRKRIELGLVPVGALGLVAGEVMLGLTSLEGGWFRCGLVTAGFFGGLFIVPLNAFLQDEVEEERRGRILAASNLLCNFGGVAAVGLQVWLAKGFELSARGQILTAALPGVLVAVFVFRLLPQSVVRLFLLLAGNVFYRVRVRGVEHWRAVEGRGALLVSNHVTYVDAVVLQLACPRVIRFIAFEEYFKKPLVGRILRLFGAIPISPERSRDAVRKAVEAIEAGEVVCIFPEGQLTRTGEVFGFRKGFELIARKAKAGVIPVYMDELWGSVFSYYGNRYFWKLPPSLPRRVKVFFGEVIGWEAADAGSVRTAVLDLGERAFGERPELNRDLGSASVFALARRPWRTLVIDRSRKRCAYKRGELLGAAWMLSREWRRSIPGKRVGVALPPGVGGILANLGLTLAGKVPVNLNVTSGREAGRACLEKARITTVITVPAMVKKFSSFPWVEDIRNVEEELTRLGKGRLLVYVVMVYAFPGWLLKRWILRSGVTEAAEVTVLFSSGSSGTPKGVPLTHRNILANVAQVAGTAILEKGDLVLGCLPFFHSFGMTVTLWFPILNGTRVVTVPSPLEAKRIGEAVREEKVSVLLGTPTFLAGYARKIKPEEFASVRIAMTGAEKLPERVKEVYAERYGLDVLEGYGLTETSPVVCVSSRDPEFVSIKGENSPEESRRSVGRLVPGMAARIVEVGSGEVLGVNETGLLRVKGPNVFGGYLEDEERSQEVLEDGWFTTGDLARIDEDGFVYIEGRLSRFSKIGGEMVPHGVVEEKLEASLGQGGDGKKTVVVLGIPDEERGEALVVLTTCEVQVEEIRNILKAAGLPNLWIPKKVCEMDEIPLLGSGKVDLMACKKYLETSEL